MKPITDFIPDKYSFKLKGAINLLNEKYDIRKEYAIIYEKVLKKK